MTLTETRMTIHRFLADAARPCMALAATLVVLEAAAMPDPAQAAAALAADVALQSVAGSSGSAERQTPQRPVFAARALSANDLGKSRGGNAASDTVGSLRNTTATNVESGSNAVRDGSFANAAGLTTVIQNSGSNVLIQNSTTVNVQFRP